MSKDKKGQFDHYQTFELEDGTKFKAINEEQAKLYINCLLYTSPSPRDQA